ncbi:MAG: LbetaH domain-containing protein [Vulcanimicrobiaceae bacterium]
MGRIELASRFFLFNKMQNGIVCMYDTVLPDTFLLIHTVGTVLGKASYGRGFVAYQNVTVGTESLRQPAIGERVVIYGGSMVLGATSLGDGSVISANSTIIDATIPPNHIAIGRSPELLIKMRRRDFQQQYWDAEL